MEIIRKAFPVPGTPEPDVAVIAIGDIHGRFDLLTQILDTAKKTIPEDAKQVDLVFLGDIIDRGDAAIEVLDLVREGIKGLNVIPILGNHEQLLLRVLAANDENYKRRWALWRGNGGLNTLENLQIKIPPIADTPVEVHRAALLNALGQERIDFLNSFKSHHRSGNILCVHGGIDPEISLHDNFAKDKLSHEDRHWAWIRDGFLNYDRPYPEESFVVHGHTVIPGPRLEPHRIGLDTGACIYGVLSGATFFDQEMTIFQVTAD